MTGSFINGLYEAGRGPTPEVGMGATRTFWTDRRAGTITWVAPNGKSLRWTGDKTTRTDSNGMSDAQSYSYERGSGEGTLFTLRKNGAWVAKGAPMRGSGSLIIGIRDEHYDYSF